MKIEIDDKVLIDTIVEKVVERLGPLLKNSHDSVGDKLMNVNGLAGYLGVAKQWVYEKTHLNAIQFLRHSSEIRTASGTVKSWERFNPYQ